MKNKHKCTILKPISTESIPVPFVARHYCLSSSSESSAGASFDVFGGRTSMVRCGCKGQVVEWGAVEWSGMAYGLCWWERQYGGGQLAKWGAIQSLVCSS
ncbi:hypothetical protein QYF36_017730 [Acer negundo]|nr:hypothetical protein QYF36_017730 [Acer negundo]